jgi:hypothetical protein
MSDSSTVQAKPESSISGKAWLCIIGALGLGLLAGVMIGSTQLQGWKDLAADWKALAEQQKTSANKQAEEDAAYAARWQAAANKSSAVTERCFALVDKLQGPVPSTNQP